MDIFKVGLDKDMINFYEDKNGYVTIVWDDTSSDTTETGRDEDIIDEQHDGIGNMP